MVVTNVLGGLLLLAYYFQHKIKKLGKFLMVYLFQFYSASFAQFANRSVAEETYLCHYIPYIILNNLFKASFCVLHIL